MSMCGLPLWNFCNGTVLHLNAYLFCGANFFQLYSTYENPSWDALHVVLLCRLDFAELQCRTACHVLP